MAVTPAKQVFAVDLSRKPLPRPLAKGAARFLNRLFGFEQFNAIYNRVPACTAEDFSRTFLDTLGVRVEVAGHPLSAIPSNGPLIAVANHPNGLLDGMVLEMLIGSVRPRLTVMAIHFLAMIPEYRDRWIFVGRPGSRSKRKLTMRSWRRSFEWLDGGGALVVFPAGRVSRFQWNRYSIADEPWSPHIATLARRTGARIVPVYLRGPVHWGSQLTGIFLPLLQNLRSIAGLSKFRGQTLRVFIGRPIDPDELSGFATDGEAIAFLREQTEKLARSR